MHIVLGLSSRKSDAGVSVVYAGRSGAEARTAMDSSASPHFLVMHHPAGIPKNNPRVAANAARIAEETKAQDKAAAVALTELRRKNDELMRELLDTQKELAELKAKTK